MNVVLDTNVLVSGLLFGGVPGRILAAWSTGSFRLVISPPMLDEYRRVGFELSKGREPLVSALEALLAMLTVHAVLVNAPPLDERITVRIRMMTCFSPPPPPWPGTRASSFPATSISCRCLDGEGLKC